MKVAFVGKGGAGKTTVSSLFIRHLVGRGLPVMAIDADINQQLGASLGLDEEVAAQLPALGDHLVGIKEYLRGDNPRIASATSMVKTTPPGAGSRLLRFFGTDPIHGLAHDVASNCRLMVTGAFSDDDLGVACYHSKTGAVELYLNHLIDQPDEYVAVDMTAGADSFASGLFTRFDLLFLVAEPTRKGVGVYRQYKQYAADYDVAIKVIGNKVASSDDVAYLRDHVGDDLLGWLGQSAAVRAIEQGREDVPLEPENVATLELMQHELDARPRDWKKFLRQGVEFHIKNARSWANRATGENLEAQVDPDFRYPV